MSAITMVEFSRTTTGSTRVWVKCDCEACAPSHADSETCPACKDAPEGTRPHGYGHCSGQGFFATVRSARGDRRAERRLEASHA